jgi:hypothetical protein
MTERKMVCPPVEDRDWEKLDLAELERAAGGEAKE